MFNGDSRYESAIYTAKLTNQFGCDSTVVLDLIVNEVPQLSLSATICAGEFYPLNGEFFSAEGIYVGFFQTTEGCDSNVILDLRVTSVDTGVSVQDSTMSAQSGYQDYQWINCDTGEAIAGATDSDIQPASQATTPWK